MRKLLANLNIYSLNPPTPIRIFVDSTGAIKTAENPIESDRTKHFDIRYHFVRDEISTGRILVTHVPSKDNLVGGLTKPLTKPLHERFVTGLRIRPV